MREQILLYFLALAAPLGKRVGGWVVGGGGGCGGGGVWGVIGMQASTGQLDEPGPEPGRKSTTAPLCPQN